MSARTLVSDAFAVDRTSTLILSFFAGIALLLAAMGIYGVLAHSVLERRHEIGVRLALGARRADVLRIVIRQALDVTLAGAALGVVGAVIVARAISSSLAGVRPADPLTLGASVTVLAIVALAGCTLPARRASRLDAIAALRQ
jgi:ABC-type antimicrobial peptide transport system permease subunit